MKWRDCAALFLAAGLLVHAVWLDGAPLALLALMPLLGSLLQRRAQVAAWWSGYYLVGLYPLAGATSDYFGGNWLLGGVTWAGLGLGLCAVWTLAWAPRSAGARRRAAGVLLALSATLLPPLGALGFLHPLLAAGSLLPGSGFAGLVWLTLAWCLLAALPLQREGATLPSVPDQTAAWRRQRGRLATGALMLLVALCWVSLSSRSDAPVHDEAAVRAISTRQRPAANIDELAQAVGAMAAAVRAEPPGHAALLVFPETAIAEWRPASEQLVRTLLLPLSYRQAILFGTVLDRDRPERSNAVAILQRGEIRFLRQRQPVPLGMWAPWSQDHFRADWLRNSVVSIDQRELAILVCGEEFSLSLSLLSFASAKPALIVALSNHWWSRDPEHDRLQARHTQAVAALFGVPYLRAVNRGQGLP